jgi:predicted anti-sigma-YlaC factor YlaD
MKCLNKAQLQELLDNMVSEKSKKYLEAHLKHCQKCRSELETIKASLMFVKEELRGLDPRIVPSDLFNPSRMGHHEHSNVSTLLKIMGTSVQVPVVALVFGAVAIIGLALLLFFTNRQLVNSRPAAISKSFEPRHETLFISSPTQFQAYQSDIRLKDYRPIRDPQVILFKEEIK